MKIILLFIVGLFQIF